MTVKVNGEPMQKPIKPININGKVFDFDGHDLFEGERGKSPGATMLHNLILLAALGLVAYFGYPWVVWALKVFFKPLAAQYGIFI